MKLRKLHLPDALLQSVRAARNIVVLTGSGLGPASRLPVSRDGMRGLWGRYDAEALATEAGFQRDPGLAWAWHEERRRRMGSALPSAAHRAIAALAALAPATFVVTQNGDALHELAGSPHILHLQGRIDQAWCSACGVPHALGASPGRPPRTGKRPAPPSCRICAGPVRPGRLWHGEPPHPDVWRVASGLAASADMLLAVGTSCLTPAAADLCYQAIAGGAEFVQINPNPTALDRMASHNVRGAAEKALPMLLARAWPGR